jgi:hypothetical protein
VLLRGSARANCYSARNSEEILGRAIERRLQLAGLETIIP